jgi:exonuclease III
MGLALFLLLTASSCAGLLSGAPHELKCVSWNVNGVAKLRCSIHEKKFLASFDVVFLQETYAGSFEDTLTLEGFIPHHQVGRPTTRRYQWGVSSYLRIDAFVGGIIRRLPTPMDWMVVSRWSQESDRGVVFVNIYLPVHSDGFGSNEVQSALAFLNSLRSDYPADGFILGGDFNVDRWRTSEQRSSGVTIPTTVRLVTSPL